MAKVVYTPIKRVKPGTRTGSLPKKRVRSPDGESFLTIHSVDADSPTFGDDLSDVFRENVRKARRNNKRLTGSADRVPAKD